MFGIKTNKTLRKEVKALEEVLKAKDLFIESREEHWKLIVSKKEAYFAKKTDNALQNYNQVIQVAGEKSSKALRTFIITACYKFRDFFGTEELGKLTETLVNIK